MLANAEQEQRIKGVKVSRNSPMVTHLMYADDVVIYCRANSNEAAIVRCILQEYCQATGQEINWDKSSIHFSANTTRPLRSYLCNLMGMKECNHRSLYLGLPFCKFNSKKEAFGGIMEKLANKLSGWKKKSLSMAGRLALIKSVAISYLCTPCKHSNCPSTC